MFAIQPPQSRSSASSEDRTDRYTPNVLPCRIHHDGPVGTLERYWIPLSDEKDPNLQTSHYRGRRLRGRRVQLPEGYEGVIATHTERTLPRKPSENYEDAEVPEPVKVLEKQGSFDDLFVWGHEEVPAADDAFVKGVQEWVKLAEAMHGPGGGKEKELPLRN